MSGLVRFSTGSCTKWSSTLYVQSNHQFLGGNPVLLTMEILTRSENLTRVGWAPTEWTEKAAAACLNLPAPFRPEARSRPAVCHSRGVTTLTTPEAIVHAEPERKSLPFPYRYTCWPTPFTPPSGPAILSVWRNRCESHCRRIGIHMHVNTHRCMQTCKVLRTIVMWGGSFG